MFQFRSHIAFLLLVIFVFPTLVQPIHEILLGCDEDEVHEHHKSCSSDSILPAGHHQVKDEAPSCGICDFSFSANDGPDSFTLQAFDLDKTEDFSKQAYDQYSVEITAHPSLRAPPVNLA